MSVFRGGRSHALILALIGSAALATEPEHIPDLPQAISNNAVAQLQLDGQRVLVSLMGLGSGKTWRDTTARVYRYRAGDEGWQRLPDVPGPGGRLAGTAVGVDDRVLVFGGYTLAEDESEVSVNLVHGLDPVSGEYEVLAPMPVPVDDAVSLVHRDRYVYLVSGWHDSGNVNLVQVYDAEEDRWFQATPFPGAPVFGHAGGISGRRMIICDGVRIQTPVSGPRTFEPESACYLGEVDAEDPVRIRWRRLAHHGGPASYRMAARGSDRLGMVVFAGGSDNPYNYNGIGYDGVPSQPSDRVFAYHLEDDAWRELGKLPEAAMDHRGLLEAGDAFLILGGMRRSQAVSSGVLYFSIPRP